MRRALFLAALFALLVASHGSCCNNYSCGQCSRHLRQKCDVQNCAVCQDSRNKCAICSNGYKSQGTRKCEPCASQGTGSCECPAAVGPNCLSCSEAGPGAPAMTNTANIWNPACGCSVCPQNYHFVNTTTPAPAGLNCGGINTTKTTYFVRACAPTKSG